MIEIKFTGGPGTIHDSIRSYLKQAGVVEDKPAIDYHFVESASNPSGPSHVVTLWHAVPIACTCEWFRHNPMRASNNHCRHMTHTKATTVRQPDE